VLKKLLVNEIKDAKERQLNIGNYRGGGFSREERGKSRPPQKSKHSNVLFSFQRAKQKHKFIRLAPVLLITFTAAGSTAAGFWWTCCRRGFTGYIFFWYRS